MSPWLWLLASYLLGAVPFSYLAGRYFRGIDLREHGSGNLGATNAFRVLGWRIAALVMIVDVLKGFVPVWFFVQWTAAAAPPWDLAFGAAAILGHVFPAYIGFRGGKGVATAAGVFLALAPHAVGVGLIVWLATFALFRMVSLASLAAAVGLILVLLTTELRPEVRWLGVGVGAFVIFAHRGNIGRIARGEEYRFGRDTRRETAELETAVRDEESG